MVKKEKDGKPAIFASEEFITPIIFAIFNQIQKENFRYRIKENNGKITIETSIDLKGYPKNNKIEGYVYIFKREDFFERNNDSFGLVSEKELEPVGVIKINSVLIEKIGVKIKKYKKFHE